MRARRVLALLLALGVAVASGFGALVGVLWGFGLKCDDACSPSSPRWRDHLDAWQWDAIGWLALAGLGCSLVFAVAVLLGRTRLSALAIGLWGAIGGAYLSLFAGSGLSSHDLRVWFVFAGLVAAGATSVALLGARPGSQSRIL